MKMKKITAALLAAALAFTPVTSNAATADAANPNLLQDAAEIQLPTNSLGNPIGGFKTNAEGERELMYGGDPSVLIDGDTAYLYIGHDASTADNYVMPGWDVYESTDMIHWTYDKEIMSTSGISWKNDANSAWAGQVLKHFSDDLGMDVYYFYFCTWTKTDSGKQSIGCAVSSTPTGEDNILKVSTIDGEKVVEIADTPSDRFVDLGEPLVKGSVTTNESSAWNDIDPTGWIEMGEDGEEHRYLAWGNGKYFVCELNEDMISIKDRNGDGIIKFGTKKEADAANEDEYDIIEQINQTTLTLPGQDAEYTEAPYLYRRQDENGNYYGPYYLFYAMGWRENMAYATCTDLMKGDWTYGGKLMPPSATANTNHMAVFDFKGTTYFVYHNGVLPWGSGYRRVACVEEFTFNQDGSIDPIPETAVGISGTKVTIADKNGKLISHENWTNTMSDNDFPYSGTKAKNVSMISTADEEDSMWSLVPGKADTENLNYVSIQSNNKPGLYLTENRTDIVLAQDSTKDEDGSVKKTMTFKTVAGLNGTGVSFESVSKPGYYLTSANDDLSLTTGEDANACSFSLTYYRQLDSIQAQKTNTVVEYGAKIDVSDIKVSAFYRDETSAVVENFATNADKIDTKIPGEKILTVSYTENGKTKTSDIKITVKAKPVVKVSKITIKSTASLTEGQKLTLKPSISPSNATNKTLKYSSSKTSLATVSSNGVVTAKKAGTVKIVIAAMDGSGAKATVKVTIKAKKVKATKVTLSKSKITLKAGKSVTLKASMKPKNTTDKITWSTSNKKVAKVKNGKVTGVKKGTAKITAKATSGKKATCTVTVKK